MATNEYVDFVLTPGLQMTRAIDLSYAHFHGWTTALISYCLEHEMDVYKHSWKRSFIDDLGEDWLPYTSVWMDDLGCIRHTTASNRTSWCIEPDGTTTIWVSRPRNPQAITVHIPIDIAHMTITIDHIEPVYLRHADALMQALKAFFKWNELNAVIEPYMNKFALDEEDNGIVGQDSDPFVFNREIYETEEHLRDEYYRNYRYISFYKRATDGGTFFIAQPAEAANVAAQLMNTDTANIKLFRLR